MKTNKYPLVFSLLISLLLISCAQQPVVDNNAIFDKTWTLTTMDSNSPTSQDENRLMSIHFEQKSNRLYGYAGCNNYTGQYEITDNQLNLTMLITTRMLCRETAKKESNFIAHLESSNSFTLKNDQLQLRNKENIATLVFNKE